ncbi:helix-turn-helix transcriptional regulator [Curvibacter sp. RS43]|uniref:helix-turn-helix transcriptional regulator n=1 Tax=Curvibacter microcysteis TaxID=3026419 RepID=UPI00236311E0|nr:helix-turn-helix transcriptional regulator [Curvibacter sp. RS43]MDD0810028.1 helix-turn-helix transcriptional regulator [Curvibacter sp. RS43]
MPSRLAYHLVVKAMEARAGVPPMQRYVSAIESIIHGHLPYNRYVLAGEARARQGAGTESIARDVRDFFSVDLNPAVRGAQVLKTPEAVAFAYNSYNQSAQIAVKTEVHLSVGSAASAPGMSARRTLIQSSVDLELCKAGTLLVFEELMAQVIRNRSRAVPQPMRDLRDVAAELALEGSAVAQLAGLFQQEGPMRIGDAAQALGCHQRTLERQLKKEGTTAEGVRMAVRLLRAHERFQGPDSLTTIAHDEGFSDLAHMTRSFKTSCGMTPTLLRQVLQGASLPKHAKQQAA